MIKKEALFILVILFLLAGCVEIELGINETNLSEDNGEIDPYANLTAKELIAKLSEERGLGEVKGLHISVTDLNENPIEGADVIVVQNSSSCYIGLCLDFRLENKTDSNGVVRFSEQEMYNRVDVGSTSLVVQVSKEGYMMQNMSFVYPKLKGVIIKLSEVRKEKYCLEDSDCILVRSSCDGYECNAVNKDYLDYYEKNLNCSSAGGCILNIKTMCDRNRCKLVSSEKLPEINFSAYEKVGLRDFKDIKSYKSEILSEHIGKTIYIEGVVKPHFPWCENAGNCKNGKLILVDNGNWFSLSSFINLNKSSYKFKDLSCDAEDFKIKCSLDIDGRYGFYGTFLGERDKGFTIEYYKHEFLVDYMIKIEEGIAIDDAYKCDSDDDCDWINVNCCETRLYCMRDDLDFCVEGISEFSCSGQEAYLPSGYCRCINRRCAVNSTG